MLLEYFTEGTERTMTGASVGMEIETDFLLEDGRPIPIEVSQQLLGAKTWLPKGSQVKLELGRQKIELSMAPQPNAVLAIEAAQQSLSSLYRMAAEYGAYPLFAPEVQSDDQLLWVQEERDAIWVDLDGRQALEQLCRCSSVQFTVSVNPTEATEVLNKLYSAGLHTYDYAPNHQRWLNYMAQSVAGYRADRYGGPGWFANLDDYVARLSQHEVVMHRGQSVRQPITALKDADIELFVRSVWWHYRLRRHGTTLAVEVRPLARRGDETFDQLWSLVAGAIGV